MIGRDSYGPPMPPEQLPEERKFGDAITAGVTMTAGGGGNPVRQGVDMARPIPGKMMASAIKSEGFTPEMGQDLIDMGVRGTRSGMLSQISQKLPEIEQGIQDTVGASPKPVDISGVPDAIANSAKSAPGQGLAYQTRSGITGIGLQPQVNRVAALADEARGLGQTLPSPEALDHLRLLGKLGYGEGEELKTAVGGAARAGRAAMRDSLTAVHPELDPALAKEAALLEAKRGLEDQGVKSFLEDFLKGRLKLGKIIPGSTAVRSYGAAAANAALNAGDVAADAYPALEPFLKNKTLRDTQRD